MWKVFHSNMFLYHCPELNKRDIFIPGNCDDAVKEICQRMNWIDELNELIKGN